MSNKEQELSIIITHGGFILSKKFYFHWKVIANEYEDFITSLGPYPLSQVIDLIELEWPYYFDKERIIQFIQSSEETLDISKP